MGAKCIGKGRSNRPKNKKSSPNKWEGFFVSCLYRTWLLRYAHLNFLLYIGYCLAEFLIGINQVLHGLAAVYNGAVVAATEVVADGLE